MGADCDEPADAAPLGAKTRFLDTLSPRRRRLPSETEPQDRYQWVAEPLPELEPPRHLRIHYDDRMKQAVLLWNEHSRRLPAIAAPRVISTRTSIREACNAGYAWYRYALLLQQIRVQTPRTHAEAKAAITALRNGETVDQRPPEWSA